MTIKDCHTCTHEGVDADAAPCVTCISLSNWEPVPTCFADYQPNHEFDRGCNECKHALECTGVGPIQYPTGSANDVQTAGEQPQDHPLYAVFMAAIEQAMWGKGERHGGARTPFLEQPWCHYAKMHGRGFLTGQAAKKLEEAASTREGQAFETEVFGAMVYLGMAILHERSK